MKLINKLIALTLCLSSYTQAFDDQICNANITPSTPNENFTINDDGTVIDKSTGLMWMRCTYGQGFKDNDCIGLPETTNWKEALNIAENSTYAGYSDWRLPNIKELFSIVENSCSAPAINLTVFPNTSAGALWSSSPYRASNSIWYLFLHDGDTWHDTENYMPHDFKLVRDH